MSSPGPESRNIDKVFGLTLRVFVALIAAAALNPVATGADGWRPILKYHPEHPGYYIPFSCVSLDMNIFATYGGIRNSCGRDIEAYWQSATGSRSSWTIEANKNYPLFEKVTPNVLGCLPNDHLDRTRSLCKDDREVARITKEKQSSQADAAKFTKGVGTSTPQGQSAAQLDAAKLAEELGIAAPSTTANQLDADKLAKELGLNTPGTSTGALTAAQLQESMKQWDVEQAQIREQQAIQKAEADRLEAQRAAARRQQEQDAARRAEILAQQQRPQEAPAQGKKSFFGELVGMVATGVLAHQVGIDPAAAVTIYANEGRTSSTSGSGGVTASGSGEACRQDPRVIAAIKACVDEDQIAGQGICLGSKAQAACFDRAASAVASCPSVASQARDMARQLRANAAEAC